MYLLNLIFLRHWTA